MMAITWQTMAAPNLSEVFKPLMASGETINKAFDSLSNAFKTKETLDQANWEQAKKNNTNAFMNAAWAATNPDQWNDLMKKGTLQQILQQAGAQIDQDAARDILMKRGDALQTQAENNWKFANAAAVQADKPMLDRAKALIAQGKTDAAAAIHDQLSPAGQATLYQDIYNKTEELRKTGYEKERFVWETAKNAFEEKKRPEELNLLRAQITSQNAMASMSNAQANAANQTALTQEQNRNQNAVTFDQGQAQIALGTAMNNNVWNAGVFTPDRLPELRTAAVNLGVAGGDLAKISPMLQRIATLAAESNKPIPMQAVISLIAGTTDDNMFGKQGYADSASKLFKNMLTRDTGNWAVQQEEFKKMLEKGVRPQPTNFSKLGTPGGTSDLGVAATILKAAGVNVK